MSCCPFCQISFPDCRPLRYLLDNLHIKSTWYNAAHVYLLSCLTYFHVRRSKLVARSSPDYPMRYQLEMWFMNIFWRSKDLVRLALHLISSYSFWSGENIFIVGRPINPVGPSQIGRNNPTKKKIVLYTWSNEINPKIT